MTNLNVYSFNDYKELILAIESARSTFQKGFRSRLAEVLGCQNAYISQILNTHANFSLEQGLKISSFLQFDDTESRYFILLVEHARAGTPELKKYFERDIKQIQEQHLNIKNRVQAQATLTKENEVIYYSSWLYPTLHILITLPGYRTLNKIRNAFPVPESALKQALLFLVSCGLVIEKEGHFSPGPAHLHLSKDSPNIIHHHTNWRMAAIQSLSYSDSQAVHYSTVSTLSYKDAEKLKEKFVQLIQEYVQIVGPSKEETLYNFNLDFYSLISK